MRQFYTFFIALFSAIGFSQTNPGDIMRHFYITLIALFISALGFGQTIGLQDFETSPQSPVLNFTNSGGSNSTGTGPVPSGDNNFVSGIRGWEANNTTSTLTFNSIDVSSFSSVDLSFRLASFAGTSGNGSDGGDEILVEISIDGGSTFSNEIEIQGNNNAKWSFDTGTGIASTIYDGNNNQTIFQPSAGGFRTTDGYSFISVTSIPSTSNLVIRITMNNNSNNEYWIIDDVVVQGTGASGPSNPDSFSTSAISSSQIDLSYDDNTNNDDVVIAFNTDNVFDTPSGIPTAGNFFGDDEILFVGSGAGTFNHIGLTENTTYFYKAYSYDGTDYSSGLEGNATTPCSAIVVTQASPFQEGFEGGTVPPSCWTSYTGTNGLGITEDWQLETTEVNSGNNAAYVSFEDVSGGNAEDWLVSPALDLSSLSNTELSFFAVDEFSGDFGTIYTVRVSTTSQTDIASFTTEETYNETDFGATYSQFIVDLSAYDGQTIYIAFVMSQDDGDSWFLDDIEVGQGLDKDTEVLAPDTQIAASTITAANATTALDAVPVFKFKIEDKGTSDTEDTAVTRMRFVPGTSNTADWTDHIQGITLFDVTDPMNPVDVTTNTTVTINDLEIIIDYDPALIILDNSSPEFELGIYLNISDILDGSIVQMEIPAIGSGFEADPSGSIFLEPQPGTITGPQMPIDVLATELGIQPQLPSQVEVNQQMPIFDVLAIDVNGNLDLDYSQDIDITSSGVLDMSPLTQTAVNGVATFNSVTHVVTGTNIVLSIIDNSLPTSLTGNSTPFNVVEPSILFEDFDDGNFTNDPIWTGSTTAFSIINDATVPNGNATADGSYLASNSSQGDVSLAVESAEVSEWHFSIASPNYNPSNSNNFGVVLMASTAFSGDLTANNFQGYYIRLGSNGSTDRLQLWRKTGVGEVNIGDFPSSPDFDPGALQDGLNIRITRSEIGEFELFYSTGFDYSSEPTNSAGTLIDNTYNSSAFFGVFQVFSNTSTSRRIYFDNLDLITPTTYIYNDGWSPSDPNGISLITEAIVIEAGDAVISTNTDINTVIVNPGASLTVDSGVTLTITDATEGLTLESTSSSYSSLIRNGTITGTIHYERYVNQISSGPPGNDLVSIPLTEFDLNFQSFLDFGTPTNRDVLATNPGNTVHAFGPYDNTGLAYVNFPTYSPALPPDPAAEPLISGKGYRAASITGANITFTGNALSNDVSIDISTPTAVVNSQWNLIGNPYPSYIDANKFLLANSIPMEDTAEAIYAYNSATYTGSAATTGNFTIINLATIAAFPGENFNISPGQGFFVPADITPGFTGTINFVTGPTATDDMRTTSGSDDYIVGRSSDITYALKLGLTTNSEVTTSFFFNDNATRGLDPGYDAATFGGGNFFSHLVENNTGSPIALQALSLSDMSDVTIPLGVNANQGEQITFSIALTTLPETVDVYLEDNVTNTITLLNNSDYVLTPIDNLNGTGRFFLRFSNTTLSNPETSLDSINIYASQKNKTIVIEGQILEDTVAMIYDLQGRLVNQTALNISNQRQTINVSHLSSGVYVVQLESTSQNKTKKIILN